MLCTLYYNRCNIGSVYTYMYKFKVAYNNELKIYILMVLTHYNVQ